MKALFSSCVLLFCVVALSCSRSGNTQIVINKEHAFFVSDSVFVRENTVTIFYNQNHPQARYKNVTSELCCTLTVYDTCDANIYRIKMEKVDNQEGLLAAKFTVPGDAVFVSADLGPTNFAFSKERFSVVVFDERGNQVAQSVPHFILNSSDYTIAKELLSEDSSLFPERNERYVALWFGLVRSGERSKGFKREVDSVCASSMHSENLDVVLTGLCAEAMVNTHYDEFDKAHSALFRIRTILGKESGRKLTYFQRLALDCVCGSIVDIGGALLKREPIRSIRNVMNELCALAMTAKDVPLCGTLMQYIDKESAKELDPPLDDLANIVVNDAKTADRFAIYRYDQTLLYAVEEYMDKNMYQEALEASELARRRFSGQPTPYSKIAGEPVPYTIGYGNNPMTFIELKGDAYIGLKDTANALKCWKATIAFPFEREMEWTYPRAASKVSQVYARQFVLDSAEKYSVYSLHMDYYMADTTLAAVNVLRAKQDMPAVSREFLMNKYSLPFERSYPVPSIELSSNKGPVAFPKSGNEYTIVVFTASWCTACRKFLPRTFAELKTLREIPHRIVLVTDEDKKAVKKMYGVDADADAFYLVKDNADLQIQFMVQGYPTILVVQNGKIVDENRGAGEKTGNELLKFFRKKIARRNGERA